MAEEKEGFVFVGQVHRVITKKDGSGRIEIDFGTDGLEEIQGAQKIALKENICFQIALVPLRQSVLNKSNGDNDAYEPDENGEIHL